MFEIVERRRHVTVLLSGVQLRSAEWTEFEDSSHFFLMEEALRFMAAMSRWLSKVAT